MKAAESKKLRELTCAAVHLSLQFFFKEQISKVIFFLFSQYCKENSEVLQDEGERRARNV